MSRTKQLIADLIEMVRLARHHGHCQEPLKEKLTAGLEDLDKHLDAVHPESPQLKAPDAAPTPASDPSTPPAVSEVEPPAPADPPVEPVTPAPEGPATPPADPNPLPESPTTPATDAAPAA